MRNREHPNTDGDSILVLVRKMGKLAFIKIGVLFLSGLASILTIRIIVSNYGTISYGNLAVIVALSTYMILAEMGLGATLLNAAAKRYENEEKFAAVFYAIVRKLCYVSLILFLFISVLSIADIFRRALNLDVNVVPKLTLSVSLMIMVLGVPFRVGNYLLMAARRNTSVIAVQLFPNLLILSATFFATSAGLSFATLILAISLSITISNISSLILARNDLPTKYDFRAHIPRAESPHISFFLITLFAALPIRGAPIIANWISSPIEVARLAAAMTFYLPGISIVQSVAPSLWIDFAERRARNVQMHSLLKRTIYIFLVFGLLGSAFLYMLTPILIEHLISAELVGSSSLYLYLTLAVISISLFYPFGMYLTSERDLKFQAICTTLAGVAYLTISYPLGKAFGASGVALSISVVVFVFQIVPSVIYIYSKRDVS